MRPYIYVTRLDGVVIAIFTRYIALVEPSRTRTGAYIATHVGGVDVQETYEDVMRQIGGAAFVKAQPQCICGSAPHASACPANPDPFLRSPL